MVLIAVGSATGRSAGHWLWYAAFALLVADGIAAPNAVRSQPHASHTTRAGSNASAVRSIPWLDRSYDFGDGDAVLFTDGHYADLTEDGECNVCMWIAQLRFGDVDADGQDEALIVLSTNAGGAGTILEGFVFGVENGAPVLRAKIEGGDRGEGGIESMAMQHGDLVVRRFALWDLDGVCCPSRLEIRRWHWVDGKLIERGPPRLERWPSKKWRRNKRLE